MRFYVPEIGDQLRLTADWTFGLYNEDRNSSLMEFIGDTRSMFYTWNNQDYKPIPCTIPAGSILKVDRIYIRKGKGDYSSLTFLWKDMRVKPKIVDRKVTNWLGAGQPGKTTIIQDKIPARPVRFWAKLEDVNKIEFNPV